MKAIFYVVRKAVKNAVLDTFRHPARLILYALIGLSLIYGIIMGFTMNAVDYELSKDIRALYGGYLALLHFITIPIMLKGLSSGTSFFSMSDVNNIFSAPLSPKKILIYGVGRQLLSMLFLVICFSSYGGMVMRVFRLSVSNALLLVGGILMTFILVQMITLVIFCISSGHPKRAEFIKYIIYAIPLYTLTVFGVHMFGYGLTIENLFSSMAQPMLAYSPMIGWVHGFIFGLLNHDTTNIAVYGILLLFMTIVSVLIFLYSKLDYYEDVLQGAENNYIFRDSIRTGTMSEAVFLGSRKINVSNTGIGKGHGANTIFYKHLKEGSRRSRFKFLNISTAVLLGVALVTGIAINQLLSFNPFKNTIIYIGVTIICSYVQFFFSAAGDWVKELGKPYIFLIPEDPVKKLIMASATSIIKPFIDASISYIILAVIVGGAIPDIITSILVYGSFGCVYIAANVLAQRIVGMNGNRGIFITFYMSLIFLLMVPGVFLGVMALTHARMFADISATVMGLPIFFWNISISLLIFLMCRNLLNNVE